MLDPQLEAEGLGRSAFSEALDADWAARLPEIRDQVGGARVLVVGAAGTIGAAAVRQLLALGPARLELVDIDENGLARLARDIRSRGAGPRVATHFNALDFAGWPGLALVEATGPFDLVLDFAAVKHVRSEKNLHTLLHMIDVNVVRQRRFAAHVAAHGLARRLFVVSTDKAADPASFMGATKLLMEAAVFADCGGAGAPRATAARFANVAYSSGSLLESYLQRFAAGQALAAPKDTRRYFISAREGARICLLAQLTCAAGHVAIPRFDAASGAVELADTAAAFLAARGRRAVFVETAQAAARILAAGGATWPVLLTPRDTSGEKEIEVFRGAGETTAPLGLAALQSVRPAPVGAAALEAALAELAAFVSGERPTGVAEIEAVIRRVLPAFRHAPAAASLDDRISPRRVALAIFRLAPAGGLEQHALRLAEALARRGAAVTLVTTRPPQTPPDGVALEVIRARGFTNHGRLAAFATDAARAVADRFDVTVACHAIPGFDVIFCADPSRARPRLPWRWLPRYRTYARLERAAFAPGRLGRALMLSSAQLEGFARNTGAPRERLTLLAPTVDRSRLAAPTAIDRAAARQRLGLGAEDRVWLWMGLQPRTKGLDRALQALADAPEARLVVCGLDPAGRQGAPMQRLARRLGVAERARWLGFVDDTELRGALAAADLLVHPSRADVTGTVILEAMASGLPVITTAVCGYGEHVTAAGAGVVLAEPFRPEALNAALAASPSQLAAWSAAALAYARRDALYSGLERAADIILADPPGP